MRIEETQMPTRVEVVGLLKLVALARSVGFELLVNDDNDALLGQYIERIGARWDIKAQELAHDHWWGE